MGDEVGAGGPGRFLRRSDGDGKPAEGVDGGKRFEAPFRRGLAEPGRTAQNDGMSGGEREEYGELEVDGCRLVYRVQGEGPPLVLIQGVGVHGDGWEPQVESLSSRYRCLTFDNRGLGRSQPAGGPLTIERMGQDVVALMDGLGWGTAHVAGHSMGGLIALEVGLAVRARVRSLGLLCTFARGRDVTQPTPRMIWSGWRMRGGTRATRRRAFLEVVLSPRTRERMELAAWAERLAPLFGHDLADQPPVVLEQLRALGRYDAVPRLEELAGIPTLVVAAQHDRITPPALGRQLAAGVPGAHFVELKDAAHGVPLEQPAVIARLLGEHLDDAEERRRRASEAG